MPIEYLYPIVFASKVSKKNNIWDRITLERIFGSKIFHRNEKLDSQFRTTLSRISESL